MSLRRRRLGVDALLGYQSRPHADLDIVIPESAVTTAREALTAAGFTVLRNWLPTALAMRHEDGREVDLPSATPTEDGGGDQRLIPPEPPSFTKHRRRASSMAHG